MDPLTALGLASNVIQVIDFPSTSSLHVLKSIKMGASQKMLMPRR